MRATPQDLAQQLIEDNGPPPEDFKAMIKGDPEKMKRFVEGIRDQLTDEAFKSRFVLFTVKRIHIDSTDQWAAEVAQIILGNKPSPGFMSSRD